VNYEEQRRHGMPDPTAETRPLQPDKTVGDLFNQVASDVGALLSTEIDLAKLELREEAMRAGRAAKLMSTGAIVAYFAAVMLSFAAAWAIGDAVDIPAIGFLVIGVLYAIAAAFLILRGREQVRRINGVPKQTIATIKEDIQWAKQQAS
jgi:uncharacterized membrane protein YqjE